MKIRERALAILLSMVMMLAFMPAMAFAEGEEPDADGTPVAEEIVATEEAVETPDVDSEVVTEATEAEVPEATEPVATVQEADDDWTLYEGYTAWLWPGYDVKLAAYGSVFGDSVELEYQWLRNGSAISDWVVLDADEIDSDGDFSIHYYTEDTGSYTFSIREKADTTQTETAAFTVYETPVQNGIGFEPNDDQSAYASEIDSDITGNLVIPSSVSFPDGKTRTITEVVVYAPKTTSISIPASATYVNYVGLQSFEWADDDSDEIINAVPIPGFTIFGKTGSAAQAYAKKYGIKFRDLAAEAEAARQGTPDGSLPKVKIAKPKAAKKAATIKWKKLNKKQLKKSKAQKIEVWVCPNGGFGPYDTIMKTTGKKKASLKVKGLKKGTYFVKVRAIKYVNGAKMVGPWSKVKKVKIKK